MMRRAGLVVAALLIGLAGGCATPVPGTTSTTSAPGDTPAAANAVVPITIVRTGGIAGVNQTIAIATDGSWVYSTAQRGGATGQNQTGQLTPVQLTGLRAAVADPGFAGQLKLTDKSQACADAFEYTVSVGDEKSTFIDCNQSSRPLVSQALQIVTDATPF
jgi:hypothetical protein